MRSLGVALLVATGCQSDRAAPAPAPAPVPGPSVAASSPSAPAPSIPRDAPAPQPDGSPARVGGNWLKCYASFQPRNDPKLDVMRLGLLCGPSNGMKKAHEATAQAGASSEHRFPASAGDCFRVFAVGDSSVQDLDVEVLDPAGKRVAWDTSDDRWPIALPDGPFCALSEGEYRAVVRAQRGSGRYAIEVWRLR